MAQSKSHIKAVIKYNAEKYDRLYPFVPKGHKAEIQAAADTAGESLNDFIVTAIDERMARLGRAEKPFTPPPGDWCEGCTKLGEMKPPAQDGVPQGRKPWCAQYACNLDAPEGKARKCEECRREA